MEGLLSRLIVNHHSFNYDQREPALFFRIPFVADGVFGIVNLSFIFWVETFLMLSLQSAINIVVAVFVYKSILLCQEKGKRYLIGYGLVIPTLLCAPFYILDFLKLQNVTLMLSIVGAIPNLLLLRVVEAMHGTLPSFAKESMVNFVLYCSSPLQIMVDINTNNPVRFSRKIFFVKARRFLHTFLQTSILYSILIPFAYKIAPQREIHGVLDLYYWGNLTNAFLMASLTSLILDGGASGLGLLTSICTGITLQPFSDFPMSQSSSPSDFWGRRWDRPVASALKRGAFFPLQDLGCHRHIAALLTFITSGCIHEYALILMSMRQGGSYNNPLKQKYQPALGNQFLFFVWNGIVLLLEWAFEGHLTIEWIKRILPKSIRTGLVLLTVLPIAHLFTDEYVKSCFYGDAAFAFPIITYSSSN